MMRQTGRTTKTALRALKLAEKHDVVPILVPNQGVGRVVANTARDHMPLGKTEEERAALLGKLRYVTGNEGIRGLPPGTPLLADHTWFEKHAWVMDAWHRAKHYS